MPVSFITIGYYQSSHDTVYRRGDRTLDRYCCLHAEHSVKFKRRILILLVNYTVNYMDWRGERGVAVWCEWKVGPEDRSSRGKGKKKEARESVWGGRVSEWGKSYQEGGREGIVVVLPQTHLFVSPFSPLYLFSGSLSRIFLLSHVLLACSPVCFSILSCFFLSPSGLRGAHSFAKMSPRLGCIILYVSVLPASIFKKVWIHIWYGRRTVFAFINLIKNKVLAMAWRKFCRALNSIVYVPNLGYVILLQLVWRTETTLTIQNYINKNI